MENKERIRPLTPAEKQFASEKYYLIMDFLKRQKLNAEEYFDVVVFGFLTSVEIYLNDGDLQQRCNFEAVTYMYMKRALYRHFRKEKTQKRSTEAGADISFDAMGESISDEAISENGSMLEYTETVKAIINHLTCEQRKIFFDKLAGYSLKEIADYHGMNRQRVYKQFTKVKCAVADAIGFKY